MGYAGGWGAYRLPWYRSGSVNRAGVPSAVTPADAYVAEDGTTFYVAEDGTTFYVQES